MAALLCGVSSYAIANPVDGVVVGGSATISEAGKTLTVDQHTNRAIVDWRSFDIEVDETTRFNQPHSGAVALNRVNNNDPSKIMGTLSANGNIILVNPNGVFFGKDSKVDVNGLVATTADIANDKFMAGGTHFDKPGNPNATITNAGTITAKEAGLVGLVAPNVVNSGVITAKLGRVQLASGDTTTVDLYGDGLLEVKASDALTSQLVEHSGVINAEGGTIALTAAAGRELVNSTIKVTGELHAPSVGSQQGKIIIAAEGANAVIGNEAVEKGQKSGASTVLISGKIDVSGADGKAGKVEITGDRVALLNGTRIDASGATGGGEVHVGGEYLGQGETPTALYTVVQDDVQVDANAMVSGHGGEVIMYADERTEFGGSITANGAGDGDGGFVETSGRVALLVYGRVTAISERGRKGTWLLDPADLEVVAGSTNSNATGNPNWTPTGTASQVGVINITNALDAGTNVTLTTSNDGFAGNGDITVNAAITTTGNGSLTLNAYRNIVINSAINLRDGNFTATAGQDINIAADVTKASGTGTANYLFQANRTIYNSNSAGVKATSGVVNMVFQSDLDQATVLGGRIAFTNGTFTSNGGNITLSGGANVATGYAQGYSGALEGIVIDGATVNAGNGNIALRGQGYVNAGTNTNDGILIAGSSQLRTVDGTITMTGRAGGSGASTNNRGIRIAASNGVGTTGTGNIIATGISTSASGTSNIGIVIGNSYSFFTTGSGAITLSAEGTSSGFATNQSNAIVTTSGNITIYADSYSVSGAGNRVISGGILTLAAYSNKGLSIGTNVATTANVDETTLLNFTGASYVFGSTTTADGVTANTGDVTVNTTKDFADKNITFISGNDINIAGDFTKASGTGTANYSFYANRNIYNSSSAAVKATSGKVNMLFNADRDGNSNGAIYFTGGTFDSLGGNITMGGGAGSMTASVLNAYGVITTAATGFAVGNAQSASGLSIASTLNANGGNILLNGRGANLGTDNNHGIELAGSILTSGTGTININGIGGGATGNSGNNKGFYYNTSGTLTNTGSGSTIITGTGGGAGAGANNHGIYINTGRTITATTTGTVSLTGQGGISSAGIHTYAAVSSADGALLVRGAGGANGSGIGVYSSGGSFKTTGAGSLTALGYYNVTGSGIYGDTNANRFQTTGTGDITVVTNYLNLNAGNSINAIGNLTLKAWGNTGMSIGTNVSGALQVNAITLGYINGASYVFGSTTIHDGVTANTGNLTINTTKDFANKNVTFISGNDILLNGTLTKGTGTGVATYNFYANRHIANASGVGIVTSAGGINLTLDADRDTNGTGTLNWTGTTSLATGTGSITAQDAMHLAGDLTLTGTGVTLNGTVDGDAAGTRSLTVNAGTGTFATTGIIGGSNTLNNLSITADDVTLGADVYGSGVISVRTATASRGISVADSTHTTGYLYIDTAEIARLKDGWSQINIGRSDGSGTVYVGASTWVDPLTFFNASRISLVGALVGNDNTSFTFSGTNGWVNSTYNITTQGGDVILATTAAATNMHDITTNGGNIEISSMSLVNAASTFTFNSGGGNITIGTVTDGLAKNMIVNAGAGTLVFNSTVDGANHITAAAGTITLGGAWGGTTPLGNVSLTSTNSLNLDYSINAASILARSTGATSDFTIASGRTLTATGTGDALVLAAGRNFINNAGSTALSAANGRWLVYSANMADNTRGGLMPDASEFGKSYAGNAPATIGAGNRFIYSSSTAPTLVLDTDNDSVTYGDAYGAGDLSYSYVSGLLGGDTWGNIGLTGSAGLSTTYVQGTTGYNASAYSNMITGTAGTLASVLGYHFSFTGGDLTVNKRTITMGLTGPVTKEYDTTLGATLASGDYSLTNRYGSDDVLVSGTGVYDTKDVGTGKTVSFTGLTLAGSAADNYQLASTSASGAVGVITKKALTVTGAPVSVVYGNAIPTATTLNFTGFAGSEGMSAIDVVPTISSTLSGVVDVGSYAGNYQLVGGSAGNYSFNYVGGNLTVTPLALVVSTVDAAKLTSQRDPTFSGYNDLLADDAAQISWTYTAAGYSGNAGTYSIIAVANDPNHRLANYTRTNQYGTFTVTLDVPPPPAIADAPLPDTVLKGFSVPPVYQQEGSTNAVSTATTGTVFSTTSDMSTEWLNETGQQWYVDPELKTLLQSSI